MKIGILTFHSQLNYGGVLQCWALQNVLMRILNEEREMRNVECGRREKGGLDEVVVIDRWLTPDNWHLERGYNHYTLRQWVRFWFRSLFVCGDFSPWFRHWRTKRFIHSQLNLTPYHFYNWSELHSSTSTPNLCSSSTHHSLTSTSNFDFPFDAIVVGSDQVWHGGQGTWSYPTPDPYLLKDSPLDRSTSNLPPSNPRPHAIAYAASFGIKSLPPEIDYAAGFKRFDAISVREAEGVKLVESAGATAVHVVDPTLLLPREAWSALGEYKKNPKHVVCYCLGEPIDIEALEEWAQRTGRTMTVIADGGCGLKPFPKSLPQLVKQIFGAVRRWWSPPRVRLALSCGPREFYRAFGEADECITNSFHAVIFSYICNCNVRFLRPATPERMGMFARIEEFAETSIRGNFIANDLTDALSSLDCDQRVTFNDDAINMRRDFSRNWLESALKSTFTPHT